MKKIFYFGLLYLVFSMTIFAQKSNDLADLNIILAQISEIKAGDKLTAEQVEKSLDIELDKKVIWNVLLDKNPYTKVEESFGYPIAYYKRTDKVIVLLYGTGKKGNVISHFINIATFNAKSGKRIDQLTMISAYGGTTEAKAEIVLAQDLKKLTLSTITALRTTDIFFDISEKGKIKDSK